MLEQTKIDTKTFIGYLKESLPGKDDNKAQVMGDILWDALGFSQQISVPSTTFTQACQVYCQDVGLDTHLLRAVRRLSNQEISTSG